MRDFLGARRAAGKRPGGKRPGPGQHAGQNAPDGVARYRDGNTKVIGFFVGQCMKAMRGQGNPRIINELLAKKLAE